LHASRFSLINNTQIAHYVKIRLLLNTDSR